jgi:hypothetical protein
LPALLLVGLATPVTAQLTILRVFKGGSVPTNAVGGGTLQACFNAAADCWELAIKDKHTVTIEYSWAALSGGTLGVHNLVSQGGSPNRETKATIRFDNDGSSVWFIDPTPKANSEYSTFSQTSQNFGGGSVNKGRVYTGASGSASGRHDLFTVCLHEIGHALGLSSANTSFTAENGDGDIDIRAPRPFAGSAIKTTSGAHLNVTTALMYPSLSSSKRVSQSAVDILCNAEISKFTNLDLDPKGGPPVCKNTTLSIPDNVFSNAGNCIPLSQCIGGGEARFQWFIDKSLIGCAGVINGIDVRPTSTFTFTAQNYEIRISHTTQTAHSTNLNTNLPRPVVVRRSGNFSFSGTARAWSPLGQQTCFSYDGKSNLTIEVRMRNLRAKPNTTVFCDSASSTPAGFRRTYALGSGSYSAATTTSSRTHASGALKIRLHFGDAVYVPDDLNPATNGCNVFPFDTSVNNWRYQMILQAKDLPARKTKITEIGFANCSGSTAFSSSQFVMSMAHTTRTTTSTSFASNLGPAPIQVYNGGLAYTSTVDQWAGIGLQCPFGYDGKRNILVEIKYRNRSGGGGGFRSNSAGTPRAWSNRASPYDNFAATTATGSGTSFGLKTRLCVEDTCTAESTEQVRIGATGTVTVYNATPGQFYQISASFGQGPGYTLPPNCKVCLALDTLWYLSLTQGPPLFTNYGGVVGRTGTFSGRFLVLPFPPLVGLHVYNAAVTYVVSPNVAFTCCTNTCGTLITR